MNFSKFDQELFYATYCLVQNNNEKFLQLKSKRHKMEEFLKLIVQINSDIYTDTWWYLKREKFGDQECNGKGICAQRTILVFTRLNQKGWNLNKIFDINILQVILRWTIL